MPYTPEWMLLVAAVAIDLPVADVDPSGRRHPLHLMSVPLRAGPFDPVTRYPHGR
jgi:hypothetical protein